jgi:ubiquitin carboxyl-terminal hydrolase MINDY-3/4
MRYIHSKILFVVCYLYTHIQRALLTLEDANKLRELLFNDTKKTLPDSWRKQGLFYSPSKGVRYGLVQKSGGPCGVLASVQALVLRHLMSSSSSGGVGRSGGGGDMLDPSSRAQQRALVLAISEMLVSASDGSSVKVCLPTGKDHLYRTSDYRPDGVSDDLELVTLDIGGGGGIGGVASFLTQHLHHFSEETGPGAVLVLFSVIFTRGLLSVKQDMDEGFAGEVRTLLDPHFYMSQEGVNLLITGRAVSNVFDGERRLEDNVAGSNVS